MMKDKKPLVASLAVSLGVGGLSALLTRKSMEKYAFLDQPPLAPPGWVFPVVWTALFILMGVAAWRVWERDGPGRKKALTLYGAQLVFNFLWTLIFFNAGRYGPALVWLVVLWGLVLGGRRGGEADDTLSRMGHLRGVSQRRGVGPEPVKNG